jgi:hypothetical protein
MYKTLKAKNINFISSKHNIYFENYFANEHITGRFQGTIITGGVLSHI